jgi:uncharacterized protein YbjT (DUF2867 family)
MDTMHDEHRYLVIGAQGFQGAALARHLLDQGLDVRGFTRGHGQLYAPEIPTVRGDLANLDDVRAAFAGITHASVVLPLVFDHDLVLTYARNVATAAAEAGLTRLVFTTNTPVPKEITPFAAYETRRAAADVLTGSDLPLVVLRPTVYLDNLFSPWHGPALVEDGVLAYPLPADRAVGWMSHADLAAATHAALHRDGVEGTVLDLVGPRAVDGAGLAAAFSAGLGREVTYVPLDVARFEKELGVAIGDEAAAGVAGIYHWAGTAEDPSLFAGDPGEVERVLGRTLPSIEAWVAAQHWDVWA